MIVFTITTVVEPTTERMTTVPSYIPIAYFEPSVFQAQHVHRVVTFCLLTFFSAWDHIPKSLMAQLNNVIEMGLKAIHCIASPCAYLSNPSCWSLQMMTCLSWDPEAYRSPVGA